MKRKRFIKLLMANGYQRNQATLIANEVKSFGSYEKTYKAFNLVIALNKSKISIEQFINSVNHTIVTIAGFVTSAFEAMTCSFLKGEK